MAAFFRRARPEHFIRYGQTLGYHGPAEWSLRRFVLHYAHLCAMAGRVDAIQLGNARADADPGANDSFPAVAQLVQLAADVRAILGPECKIGYAADWSEYFGYQPGNGDRFFHLDPLWASPDVDFVGIDNYMPLSGLARR
ncbi:MAG: glycoside hydrolase TIM-barrel-like domain-containing protein [Paracoccaceae bacterium]